jgi:hypothetical protein
MGMQIRPEAMTALGPAYTNFDLCARVERQIRTVGERWPVNNHDKSSVDVVHRAKPASRVCGKDQSKNPSDTHDTWKLRSHQNLL